MSHPVSRAPPWIGRAAAASDVNPLEGLKFFIDRESPSWRQWQAYRRRGATGRAALIWRIAREPKSLWLGRFTRPNFAIKVRRLIDTARAEVPCRSSRCSGPNQEAAGRATRAVGRPRMRTRAWYDSLARVIRDDRVVIAFEPDSLGTIDCHARSRRDDRLRLLRHGVAALSRLPNATVYLEAGASDWEPARRTAKQLRAVGIARVRGFMLNATHQDWTSANIRHGLAISRLTGGKHFIINTAENGRGRCTTGYETAAG